MNIGTEYKIESDSLNLMLRKKTASGKGWTTLGYFQTFRYLLEWMVDNDIRGNGVDDVIKIVKRLDELYALIETMRNFTPTDVKASGGKGKSAVE